jgi:hypothetical protein
MTHIKKHWAWYAFAVGVIVLIFIFMQQRHSGEWGITVYYTPVEQYYSGEVEIVIGCSAYGCSSSGELGRFPKTFLEVVRVEGVGKISHGPRAGMYIHWTEPTGYWISEKPLSATGQPLVAWQSAAAGIQYQFGSSFRIVDCGVDTVGKKAIASNICRQITSRQWIVDDRFGRDTVQKRIDLYIGEQDRERFIQEHPFMFAAQNAKIEFD